MNIIKITYQSSVSTRAGWRGVTVTAEATPSDSGKMAVVENVLLIDDESPDRNASRTGANRQRYNGEYFADREIGKRKRLSACTVIN
jgi:hypothetical protein